MQLHSARLYLCTDSRQRQQDFGEFVDAAFAGGVDIIQLRDKSLEAAQELELLQVLRASAVSRGKLWAVNDRADIAAVSGAPVLHVGQRDLPPEFARPFLHEGGVIGLSTHSPEQVAAAASNDDVGYFCTGPVWATPTKPGRTAVGLDLVRNAAQLEEVHAQRGQSLKPWFAIGGIDLQNVEEVVAAGAKRVVVVRAITEADDPQAAAAKIREALPA
ncbi:thiamine-phosphate diphosphorylase [Arthrobacter subterraneus]|uniref:Thiamine-phosphate synthase n=1 Tax=Arthrobacter subterraneus TaxID=335973 RepID=A0A1G8BZ38_9MICC|nr:MULTISPECIES: thiamine phosphate synthase [Arthrobacter]SDH38398.1 thiamine-phosphate diphosphorylase [Arthrobacter subterraneus]